jgi:hypothetical protein
MVTATDNFARLTAESLGNEDKFVRLAELIGRAVYRDEQAAEWATAGSETGQRVDSRPLTANLRN